MMKFFSLAILFSTLALELINCTEPKNMGELDTAEDWEDVKASICAKDHPKNIQDQIEKCRELDPYYKLDTLLEQCDKMRAPHGSFWYDEEKGECHYAECYNKLNNTDEFKKINKEIEEMSDETEAHKAYAKYKCIRKVLGLKV